MVLATPGLYKGRAGVVLSASLHLGNLLVDAELVARTQEGEPRAVNRVLQLVRHLFCLLEGVVFALCRKFTEKKIYCFGQGGVISRSRKKTTTAEMLSTLRFVFFGSDFCGVPLGAVYCPV